MSTWFLTEVINFLLKFLIEILSQQNLKWSYILQLQNKGLFYHIISKIKMVPYFAAAKFETATCNSGQNRYGYIYVLHLQNLRPFRHVQSKIETVPYFSSANLRLFYHVMTKIETVPYFAAKIFETVLPCQDKHWNGPIFCGYKFWDHFSMSWQELNWSHILQPCIQPS